MAEIEGEEETPGDLVVLLVGEDEEIDVVVDEGATRVVKPPLDGLKPLFEAIVSFLFPPLSLLSHLCVSSAVVMC